MSFGRDRLPKESTRTRRAMGALDIPLDEPSGLQSSFAGLKVKHTANLGIAVDANGNYLDLLNLVTDTITAGDWILFHDLTDGPNKIAFSDLEATLDHGSLAGLGDDDHTSYHTDARAAIWLAANHETTYTHTDIALNTTHRGSNGTDHGYIDQDLQTSASPTFNDLTISVPSNIYALSHDNFADFDANKHIDHTGVTLTAGTGISGGGTIAAGRTFDLDILNLTTDTIAAGDWVPFHDLTDAPNKITFANFEATLAHDNLSGYVANKHIDHTGVTLTAGTGISGGGTIAASRQFDLDILNLTTDTLAAGDWIPFHDLTDAPNKITFANFEGTLDHDNLTNFVGNKHIDHTAVTLTAGTGISGGGDISAGRTFDLDILNLTTDTIAVGDWVPFHDLTDAPNKITFANFEATLNHDNLTGHVANEHIDWTGATVHFVTTGNMRGNKMVMTGSSGHFDSQSAVNVLDFDVKVGTTINATTYIRFGRGTDSGTGTLYSYWYTGDASGGFAAYLDQKNGDFRCAREIRADSHFDVNGTNGLSGTYTFGGGASGNIASMTFTGGILTGVTTVP